MKKINLLNIGVRLMHVVTSSQIIFTHICTLTLLTKVGVYWNICQGLKGTVVLYICRKYMNDAQP